MVKYDPIFLLKSDNEAQYKILYFQTVNNIIKEYLQ